MILSVIIPTHNRFFQVNLLIKSLLEQEFSRTDLQVLLVSNLKDKRLRKQSKEWEKLFYNFKYLEVGSKGVNKARNMGIRFASGEVLYFLDDDCLLAHKDHLNQILSAHKRYPYTIGIGGGYKTKLELKGMNQFYHDQSLKWLEKQEFGGNQKISQLIGGNASYKREIFDKGFSFDSQILFGGAEESFNRLLIENGYELLFFKNLYVYHIVKLDFLEFMKKSFLQGAGSFKNRYDAGQSLKRLTDMKKEAAFSIESSSFFSFIYNVFFKLGYFWSASLFKTGKFFLFRFVYFLFLIMTSRLVLIREHIVFRYVGYMGQFYGHVLIPIFHKSPPMKIYYFTKYQFDKRIKPLFRKNEFYKK